MKKKKFIAPVFIGIVVLTVLVILAGRILSTSSLTSPRLDTGSPSATIVDRSYSGWIEYFNPDLGLDFLYPPSFKNYGWGRLSEVVRAGNKGGEICISITGCQTPDAVFEARSTSTFWSNPKNISFTNLQGYSRIEDGHMAILPSGQREVLPFDQLEPLVSNSGVEILLVRGATGPDAGRLYPPAGWYGALINVNYPDFTGIAIQAKQTRDMNLDVFKKILLSISFPLESNFPPDSEIALETLPPRFVDADLKSALARLANVVNCRFVKSGSYPEIYYPDYACNALPVITNPVTQKPYYYKSTNSGAGFIFKTKLSTGAIYSITEADFPPPTPTPPRGVRPTFPPTPSVSQ